MVPIMRLDAHVREILSHDLRDIERLLPVVRVKAVQEPVRILSGHFVVPQPRRRIADSANTELRRTVYHPLLFPV